MTALLMQVIMLGCSLDTSTSYALPPFQRHEVAAPLTAHPGPRCLPCLQARLSS